MGHKLDTYHLYKPPMFLSELVEVVSLCILYSHIYSGLLISFVDVGRLTEPR